MARKRTSKAGRKTRASRSAAKRAIPITGIQTLDAGRNACVPRRQLVSVVARFRTTAGRLNAKRHEVARLQHRIRNLESRIRELEQQLMQRSPTQHTPLDK